METFHLLHCYMKKFKNKYILILAIVLIASYVVYAYLPGPLSRKLNGYIEVAVGCEIRRLHFPSLKDELITKDCDLHNYALTPDGNARVVLIESNASSRSIINGTMKTIMKFKDTIILDKNKMALEFSVSPHGDKIAYILSDDTELNKKIWQVNGNVYVVNIDGSGDKRVFNYPTTRNIPSWFPDNKHVVVSSMDFEIFIVNTENGNKDKIIDFGQSPSVSPDGKKVAYLSHDVPVETQKKMIKYNKISERDYLAMSEEKSELYDKTINNEFYSKYFMTNSIYIYDLESKTSKKISKARGIEEPVLWSKDGQHLIYNDRMNFFQARQIYIIDISSGKTEKPKTFQGRLKKWIYE